MPDKTKAEIIKAFAVGYTVEEVAEMEEITLEEAVALQKVYANDIDAKKAELTEMGWL